MIRIALLAAAALIPICGCYAPHWSRSIRPASGHRSELESRDYSIDPASRLPRAPRPATGSVAIRLEQFERAEFIELIPDTATLRIERRGKSLHSSDGRSGPWILIEPEGDAGIRIGDRVYSGQLLAMPHSQGGLSLVNHVPMEDYVRGVVARELAIWSAPPALLEAQAIAARSYASAQLRGRPGKRPRRLLSDSTLDQAYAGEYVPGSSAAAQRVDQRLREALDATRSVVLVVDGRVLDARFHASCGGMTADFSSVFPESDPGGMTSIHCPHCQSAASGAVSASTGSSSSVAWEWTASSNDLRALAAEFGLGTRITKLFPIRRDDHGRWLEVRVVGDRSGCNLGTTELRQQLGFNRLKSSWITVTEPAPGRPIGENLTFVGRGRGHGVGFCQTGARELANRGWSARQILGKYFPSANLSRLIVRSETGSTPASAKSRTDADSGF